MIRTIDKIKTKNKSKYGKSRINSEQIQNEWSSLAIRLDKNCINAKRKIKRNMENEEQNHKYHIESTLKARNISREQQSVANKKNMCSFRHFVVPNRNGHSNAIYVCSLCGKKKFHSSSSYFPLANLVFHTFRLWCPLYKSMIYRYRLKHTT